MEHSKWSTPHLAVSFGFRIRGPGISKDIRTLEDESLGAISKLCSRVDVTGGGEVESMLG